jgi:tetratricopeptide (TPR) repeat protein
MTPEIAKLRERLQKEPTSKLFVALAEEYAKCGSLDEALSVLKEGLRTHPGYLSAHVSLGKVYLQKARIEEAKAEFESVVKLNPENLLAHRKLAKIYKDEGNLKGSRASCQVVLNQSPKDKEILALVEELDKMEERVEPGKFSSSTLNEPENEAPDLAAGEAESAASPPETSEPAGGSLGEASRPERKEEFSEGLFSATLADLYIDQGQFEKGIEIYQRILERFPGDERARERLQAAQKRLGDRPSPSVASTASAAAIDPRREEKIRRLKNWLDSIKKGEER